MGKQFSFFKAIIFCWVFGEYHWLIGIEETIVKEIEQNQLTWYGHVQRMAEGRLPKIALKWKPKQERARGGPKKDWMEGIRKAMNERNLNARPVGR
jgi:hypothetical protein